ncbi:MAG: hypothetical protein JWN71_2882 [Xanthobacteraceae bacterium]|nr:hypothetical protein [Xanthobacteraceae bacterium]
MTRLDPSLLLSRLVVMKDGKRAYDEHFHAGVNIIRGVPGRGNSVGKSTIADLIFFALGGDLSSWKPEAASCDLTFAELIINGASVTLRREITETIQQPMWIFFGNFSSALANADDGWQKFPYRRYGDKESFTQVLFRLMDMPEVPAEAEANITMHQILRLMYVDQMTPVDRIFRFEARDSALRRQAVGDLLCGVLDDRIYPAQLELRDKETAYEVATQQLSGFNRVLHASGEAFNLDLVEARQRSVDAETKKTISEIEKLKQHRFEQSPTSHLDEGVAASLKADLDKTNIAILKLQAEAGQLTYGIEDAKLLIEEIRRTLDRLKEGSVAATSLGPISFMFCPSCFTPIKEAETEHSCRLCHAHIEPHGDKSRLARMKNELELQLKESLQLQEKRKTDLSANRSKLEKLSAVRDTLAMEYLRVGRNYLTETDAKIDRLTSRLGYLERELIDISRERALAQQLAELSRERTAINEEITRLKESIASWREQRDRKQAGAYLLIKQSAASLLSQDLHTEAEFSDESDVYFNFAEDRITVNGKAGFSASSLTILRNAFHLALHWSACKSPDFRYPRFLLMDNIEDKGMTEVRSQNFQRIIKRVSDLISSDHQIIFTTSMIAPDLNIAELTVGDMYDFNNKSLKIGRPSSP